MASIFTETPIGRLLLEENDGKLTAVSLVQEAGVTCTGEETPLLCETRRQIEQYFKGRRRDFDIPLAPVGTAFQCRVWKALCEIPFGKTASYGDIARAIGSPRAFRAVGMACGRNPIILIVPCHRVLAAGGAIGGYSEGLAVKRSLLKLEGLDV